MWLAFAIDFPLMTWFFAWLSVRYPNDSIRLFIGHALSALAPIAAIFKTYGREAFEAATDLLSWIFKPFLRGKKKAEVKDDADGTKRDASDDKDE